MECLECGKELEIHDTTYSNVTNARVKNGQHTGNIYKCEDCEKCFIENLITGRVENWNY